MEDGTEGSRTPFAEVSRRHTTNSIIVHAPAFSSFHANCVPLSFSDNNTPASLTYDEQASGPIDEPWRLHQELFGMGQGPWPTTISKLKEANPSMGYGEIGAASMQAVFDAIREQGLVIPGDGDFYDLGSGRGHAVLAAASLSPDGKFKHCYGIELNPELHNFAVEAKEKWADKLSGIDLMNEDIPEVKLLNGDFLELDWSGASLVFAVSTLFEPPLMDGITEKAELMGPGSLFVTVTHPLKSSLWKIQKVLQLPMSWSETPAHRSYVFIHQKV